jgi:hypothetical protein
MRLLNKYLDLTIIWLFSLFLLGIIAGLFFEWFV